MAAGSFHVLHITKRAQVPPHRPQRFRDKEPSGMPGHPWGNPVKPTTYVASYVDPKTKRQRHYKNGGRWWY
jgi:hypothetical protein